MSAPATPIARDRMAVDFSKSTLRAVVANGSGTSADRNTLVASGRVFKNPKACEGEVVTTLYQEFILTNNRVQTSKAEM